LRHLLFQLVDNEGSQSAGISEYLFEVLVTYTNPVLSLFLYNVVERFGFVLLGPLAIDYSEDFKTLPHWGLESLILDHFWENKFQIFKLLLCECRGILG